MGLVPTVEAGMEVYGPDNQLIGTVDGVPGPRMQVAGRYMIPLAVIARVDGNRVYLSEAAGQYLAAPASQPDEPWPAEQWATGPDSPGRPAS